MKKLFAMILALAMVICLSIPAFAAEEEPVKTIVNIEASEGDTTARTYNAYKLLNLKVSHKDADHGSTCDGVNHEVDCYNYAYTVNPKYRAILQQEVFDNTLSPFWTGLNATKPDAANGVEDTYILAYLASLQGDNGSDYSTLRKTTDRIYRAILAATNPVIAADKTLTTATEHEVEQGYWMIVDVTTDAEGNPLDGNDAYSVAILTTNAQDVITIRPKASLPVLEKKVKDTNDSQYSDSTQHDWTDTADHDIGDAIPFKLTATLPTNLVSYETYTMEFHDTLASGLTLDENSFKVYLFSNKFTADEDTDLADMTPIYTSADSAADGNFYINTNPGNGESFTVTINDAKLIAGADAGKAIVVVYKATLNDNAVLGATGNANTAYLKYSNDPYNAEGMGQTAPDMVKVFTYGLHIKKIDNLMHELKGAGFTLYKYTKVGNVNNFVPVGEELGGKNADGTLKNPNQVTFDWKGLDNGRYKLVETTVPDGFNKMEDLEFTIASSMVNGDEPALDYARSQALGGDIQANGEFAGMFTMDVVNNTGSVLPSTGAQGTFMLITCGTLLVVIACVFMITRKKMSIYED